MLFYDPRVGTVFRKIFGTYKNLCISLLNALLLLKEEEKITSIKYLDPFRTSLPTFKDNSLIDVKCTDTQGKTFLVEIYMSWTYTYLIHSLSKTCNLFTTGNKTEMGCGLIEQVYSLYLLNPLEEDLPSAGDNPDSYIHNFTISPEYLKGLPICCRRFVFVDLTKFKSCQRVPNGLVDLWLRFLTFVDGHRDVLVPYELYSNPEVSTAVKSLRNLHLNEKQYRSYDRYWDNVSYERSIASCSKFAKGINLFHFMAKVIEDKKEVFTIASKMLAKGMDFDLIMDVTELTKEEMAILQNNMGNISPLDQ